MSAAEPGNDVSTEARGRRIGKPMPKRTKAASAVAAVAGGAAVAGAANRRPISPRLISATGPIDRAAVPDAEIERTECYRPAGTAAAVG